MEIGKKIDIEDKLGAGGFSTVFRCRDENGSIFAVKRCDIKKTGIPHPLELSIMTTIQHPYVNRAVRIVAHGKQLYIIQDLADGDLSKLIRKEKRKFDHVTIKKWLCQLVSAVSCLHSQGIVHADIKAGNVLLIKGDIRLSDFTLVSKLTRNTDGSYRKNTHKVGTTTHRPIENFLDREWDFSLDVWSLGITFYEIIYGELPFPYQGDVGEMHKDHIDERMVNCLLDYAERGPVVQKYDCVPTRYQYHPYHFSGEYTKDPYGLNSLIMKMLSLRPDKRPTISEIANHPFFVGFPKVECRILETPYGKIDEKRIKRIILLCNEAIVRQDVVELTIDLYARTMNLEDGDVRIKGCLLLATKIVQRHIPDRIKIKSNILTMEREICAFLGYRLHYSGSKK